MRSSRTRLGKCSRLLLGQLNSQESEYPDTSRIISQISSSWITGEMWALKIDFINAYSFPLWR